VNRKRWNSDGNRLGAVLCIHVTGQSSGVSSHLVVETRVKLHLMLVLGISQHCLAALLHGEYPFVHATLLLKQVVVALGHLHEIRKRS
jgi:hypothetical protein